MRRTVTRRVFVGAAFCLLLASPHLAARQSSAPGNLKNEDPDELYRRREDLASAARAAALWNDAVTTDFVAAWKVARAYYWLGTHVPEAERRAALERGVSAGENAVRLGPDRPEGHFWLAANMGTLAQSFGAAQGLKYNPAQEHHDSRGQGGQPDLRFRPAGGAGGPHARRR